MKRFIRSMLCLLIASSSFVTFSQLDTTSRQPTASDTTWLWPISQPDTWLHRFSGSGFLQTENSFGLVPSVQGVNELFLGLGISKAQFTIGEGAGFGRGMTLGFDVNPFDKIIAPKLNLWATGVIFYLGGNVGVTAFYYMKGGTRNFVIRPEIGLGYLKVFLNYGYNFLLRDDFINVSKHTLTLSYYHTVLPLKKRRN